MYNHLLLRYLEMKYQNEAEAKQKWIAINCILSDFDILCPYVAQIYKILSNGNDVKEVLKEIYDV